MEITALTLGDYMTNCYLLRREDSDRCLIVDPGYEAGKILKVLEEKHLQPEAILLTHGHFDHVGAVRELFSETDCDVYISEADLSLPPMITNGRLFYTHTYPPSGALTLAGLTFWAIPPGPSVCWQGIPCSPGIPCSGAAAVGRTSPGAAGSRCLPP